MGSNKKWTVNLNTHRDIYNSWNAMMARCYCPNHPAYKNYGGRGIEVCDRWKSFDNFFIDLYPRPVKHSLDRINNDGNYEPSNCRWADAKTQGRKNPKRILDVALLEKRKKQRLRELALKKKKRAIDHHKKRTERERIQRSQTKTNKGYHKANTKRIDGVLAVSQDYYNRAMDTTRLKKHIAIDCGCSAWFISEIQNGLRSVY